MTDIETIEGAKKDALQKEGQRLNFLNKNIKFYTKLSLSCGSRSSPLSFCLMNNQVPVEIL